MSGKPNGLAKAILGWCKNFEYQESITINPFHSFFFASLLVNNAGRGKQTITDMKQSRI
jgi:hypothetical protein